MHDFSQKPNFVLKMVCSDLALLTAQIHANGQGVQKSRAFACYSQLLFVLKHLPHSFVRSLHCLNRQLTLSVFSMEDCYAPGKAIQSKPLDLIPHETQDESTMARSGKRQQLKRRFSLLSIVGLTTTLMITWEGLINAFQPGLENGGPAGLIYGFLLTWMGVFSQALVMAELAAMIPLAGGQYDWVAVLAPEKSSRYLSYLTGWTSVIGWQPNTCTTLFLASTLIQGLLIQNSPSYTPQRWHATLIGYAILAFSVFINTYLATSLPKIESVFLLHVFGFLFV